MQAFAVETKGLSKRYGPFRPLDGLDLRIEQGTVHGNLRLYGQVYGLSAARIAEREKELLDFIALSQWRDSLVSNLSGDMKHRVPLACSMIHDPKPLFLDEPTVGVDPELRAGGTPADVIRSAGAASLEEAFLALAGVTPREPRRRMHAQGRAGPSGAVVS